MGWKYYITEAEARAALGCVAGFSAVIGTRRRFAAMRPACRTSIASVEVPATPPKKGRTERCAICSTVDHSNQCWCPCHRERARETIQPPPSEER